MVTRYHKPNMSLLRAGGITRVVGETTYCPPPLARPRRIHTIAKQRLQSHTPAEKEFEKILNSLGSGALRGKFIREWAFKNWIIDFYLYEVRVGVEIDGGYHSLSTQCKRDMKKASDCESAGIILLRLSNAEVFGDQNALVEKLRAAYRDGLRRSRAKPT